MADVTRFDTDLVPSRAVSALVGAVTLVLAGCTAMGDDAPGVPSATPTGTTPELAADVGFPRTLQAERKVELRVTGAEGDDWSVTSATVTSGYFEPLDTTEHTSRLFEGWTAHVPVPLGAALCPAVGAEASAVLTLASDAGETATVTVPLPTDVLAGINADECAVREVTDVAAPAWGRADASAGASVDTTLTLTRGAGEGGAAGGAGDLAIELVEMKGSVIFDVEPRDGAALPLVLASGQGEAVLPVTITATRCEPHAFAESKKTFVFAVWISVGGDEPAYVEVRPDQALKGALQSAFDACGATQN